MDFLNTLLGSFIAPYAPYLTAAVTVASAAATVLPPPTVGGTGFLNSVYALFYGAVHTVALNKGNAKAATAK